MRTLLFSGTQKKIIKMHCAIAFIAVGVFALSVSHAAPLDLGKGGVFEGADAQSYFATRFGADFFTRLAAVMAKTTGAASHRKSSKSAHAAKSKEDEEKNAPELRFETEHPRSESTAAGSAFSAVVAPDSLYRDAVAPRNTEDDAEEYTYDVEETNTLY